MNGDDNANDKTNRTTSKEKKKNKPKKITTAAETEARNIQMKTMETKSTAKDMCISHHSEDNCIFDKIRNTKSGVWCLWKKKRKRTTTTATAAEEAQH